MFRLLLIFPLFLIMPACGLMTSINALEHPVENGTSQTETTFKFRIYDSAWAGDGSEYVYFGIEVYYKIFTSAQPSLGLSYSNQLSSNGFRRMYREEDLSNEDPIKPMLYFEASYKGYTYLDFDCAFDDETGIFTMSIKDDNDPQNVLETFELKRAVAFPAGHDEEYYYKGFNDFEENDSDINDTIWNGHINAVPTERVYIMLYAFSYGYSLDPNHMWAQIESPLEYVGQLEVMCQKYED
jgi:hypothetical protein